MNIAMKKEWFVHKFGGTSVATADRIQNVVKVMRQQKGAYQGIVVSALSGVTDQLIQLVEGAVQGQKLYLEKLQELKSQHLKEAYQLFDSSTFKENLDQDCAQIEGILREIEAAQKTSLQALDFISGYGEIWSAQMLHYYLQTQNLPSQWLDARDILVVYPNETGICIDWPRTRQNFQSWHSRNAQFPWWVITGFIASTTEKKPTTLGRNGSDYSATLFGSLLEAREITIWTDVDGIMSADPRIVPEATVLESMSYAEATELAYFGAKVIHPTTMAPAIEAQIPVWIRNTFNSRHPGTQITNAPLPSVQLVKAISAIPDMALITVEGLGMVGIPGVAHRLFGALREVKISVVLISQASSEHSICFVIPRSQSYLAQQTLEKAFDAEIQGNQISSIKVTQPCGILAAVGDGMVNQPGSAAKFFTALGRGGVSIQAIAQGASERNISTVVHQDHLHRSLRILHSAFFLSNQTLSIGLLGVGNVGHTLLNQIEKESDFIKQKLKIDLKVRGIANSKQMLLDEMALPLKNWSKRLTTSATPFNLDDFVSHIHASHLPHTVIIDCTSDDHLAKLYPVWLSRGIHIISANKKSNTGDWKNYQKTREICQKLHTRFQYETHVGAGLPIIRTLQELLQTGDQIQKIEGVLSGTLSYLFNSYNGKYAFSRKVREAQKLGYTEPNPAEDLSGKDVARKLLILAREIGLPLELNDIEVEDVGVYSDQQIQTMFKKYQKSHQVLRYAGTIVPKTGKVKAGLAAYPIDHPFARIQDRDNLVIFTTQRYSPNPLTIQGPGAGAEVTAAGIFSDLLRLGQSLGGSL